MSIDKDPPIARRVSSVVLILAVFALGCGDAGRTDGGGDGAATGGPDSGDGPSGSDAPGDSLNSDRGGSDSGDVPAPGKPLGQPCVSGGECSSGQCADGVCCASKACGTCETCNLAGGAGTCKPVPPGIEDADSNCSGANACNGKGLCGRKNGIDCGASDDCASGFCVDGFCCNSACRGTCQTCNQTTARGTCSPIFSGKDEFAEVVCVGNMRCVESPPASKTSACKFEDGQPCAKADDCASGMCSTSFQDNDEDGYGNPQTRRQQCGPAPNQKTATNGDDCDDTSADAKPGQTAFFTSATPGGGWDYDCANGAEKQFPDSSEWRGATPAECGVRVTYEYNTTLQNCGSTLCDAQCSDWRGSCTRTCTCSSINGVPFCIPSDCGCKSTGQKCAAKPCTSVCSYNTETFDKTQGCR